LRRIVLTVAAVKRALVLASVFAFACSGTPEGTIQILTGDETDTFTRDPAPVMLVVERLATDGTRSEIARAALPNATVDLGDRPRSEVGAIAVRAEDAQGRVLVRGESLFVQWGALSSTGLDVFVQRTGELARMPRGPQGAVTNLTALLAGRYVLSIAGRGATLYDLLTLRTLSSAPTLPREPKSLGAFGTTALLVDEMGATAIDLSDGSTSELSAPAGGSFAEISGGARTLAGDAQYIVGGTRPSGPTTRVLAIDAEGKASFASLNVARQGACATYVEGRGLVVVGGAAEGAGIEILAPGALVAAPLPYPSDAATGCAAATLDVSHVLVVGGTSRVFDLACTADCTPVVWADAVPLVRAEAHALGSDAAFIVGDDAAGATRTFRVTPSGPKEIPTKIARRGARSLRTSTGSVVVVGGALGIEQYLE
jgi:hypothetical protein